MIEKTLARRYASALLTLANQKKAVEQIEEEILNLRDLYAQTPLFKQIMAHPGVSKTRKHGLLEKALQKKFHPLLVQFLQLLIEKNRFRFLPDIADMFDELADAYKGVVRVKVRSYLPLSAAQEQSLQQRLSALVSDRVSIDVEEDRTLKGGMLIRFGDTIIDGSVSNRLKILRDKLETVSLNHTARHS